MGCQRVCLTGLEEPIILLLYFSLEPEHTLPAQFGRESLMKSRINSSRTKTTLALAVCFTLIIFTFHRSDAAENKGNAAAGKVVFEKNCIGCHGKTGEGLGPMSKLPNFKESATMTGRSDKDLFDKITNGGKGTGMPAWGSLINEKDRWNLVAYIRSLATGPAK